MGAEHSTAGLGDQKDIVIPSSLKSVFPFLHDAQMHFKIAMRVQDQLKTGTQHISLKRLGILHVDYALQLVSVMKLKLGANDIACLDKFREIRDITAVELGEPKSIKHEHKGNKLETCQLLLVEADAALAIAEEQVRHGFRMNAMLNFHVASIFYRLLDVTPPTTQDQVIQRLLFASFRNMQQSDVTQNFIREHFSGSNCANTYEIHGSEKLGKGSYGSVYLSTHRRSRDNRAIKVMNVENVTSYYLRKLHTEISVLKSIDHPNIIQLNEVFFGRHSVYLVTNYCKGGELFELLNSGKSQGFVFREDRGSALMLDMLRAVHYLHSIGIVHRDLKLENFMFEEKSSASSLILIDFGLSRRFEMGEKMNQRVGSCYYTAPEILKGEYDYRCDVWSLGVLCYMILSGSPPFFGKTVEDVYAATLQHEPLFPDNKFKHISAAGIDFIRRLLVKNPDERMTTAEALNHPFIRNVINNIPAVSDNESSVFAPKDTEVILRSIMLFMKAPTLVKLIATMVARMLSPEEVRFLRDEFISIDIQNEGVLTLQGFYKAFMNAPSVLCGDVDLYTAFDNVCISSSGSRGQNEGMRYHDYIAAAMIGRVIIREVYVTEVFAMLDCNASGVIDAESIRKVLGDDFARTDFRSIFEQTPKVSLNVFVSSWTQYWNPMYALHQELDGKGAPKSLTLSRTSSVQSLTSTGTASLGTERDSSDAMEEG